MEPITSHCFKSTFICKEMGREGGFRHSWKVSWVHPFRKSGFDRKTQQDGVILLYSRNHLQSKETGISILMNFMANPAPDLWGWH